MKLRLSPKVGTLTGGDIPVVLNGQEKIGFWDSLFWNSWDPLIHI